MPGWANCLDLSMSIWMNKFSCPGFMFVPRKLWPFGNEYHMDCCCATGITWGIDLMEGKDHPHQMRQQTYDNLGAAVGLLLQLLAPIFFKRFNVILDSGFNRILSKVLKSFWSCTHVNSCQKYTVYINLHILLNIVSKTTPNIQESRKSIKSLKR